MPFIPIPKLAALAVGIPLLLGSARAGAAELPLETAQAVQDCMAKNIPDGDDLRTISLTSIDAAGNTTRVTTAEVFATRGEQTKRRVLLNFTEPEDVLGTALLILVRDGMPEFHLHSPDLGTRVLEGEQWDGSLFGTDLTVEDVARYQGMLEPGQVTLGDAGTYGEKKVYALESRPRHPQSAYSKFKTLVDPDTCVMLSTEMYERETGRLRKVMSVDPDSIRKVGGIPLAHVARFEDIFDKTETRIEILSVGPIQIDGDIVIGVNPRILRPGPGELPKVSFPKSEIEIDLGLQPGVGKG